MINAIYLGGVTNNSAVFGNAVLADGLGVFEHFAEENELLIFDQEVRAFRCADFFFDLSDLEMMNLFLI
jgi:hypothetical protein